MAKKPPSTPPSPAPPSSAPSILTRVCDFVRSPDNRAIVTWIGGGLVVVIGGLWVAITTPVPPQKPDTPHPPVVIAQPGGVAIGHDNTNSPITIGTPPPAAPGAK